MLKERLKELRIEKNLLQKDIANLLNITASAYGFYEQGRRVPDAYTVIKLSKFFNVSSDYLLGNTDIRLTSNEVLKIKSVKTKLTDEELNILELFRHLNEKEKIKIEGMLEMKVSEANDLKRGMSSNYPSGEEAATILVKDLA